MAMAQLCSSGFNVQRKHVRSLKPIHARAPSSARSCACRDIRKPHAAYKTYAYRHASGALPERQQVNRLHKQYERQKQREAESAAPLGTGATLHALWSMCTAEPSITMQCCGHVHVFSHLCIFSVPARPHMAPSCVRLPSSVRFPGACSLIWAFCPSSRAPAAMTSSRARNELRIGQQLPVQGHHWPVTSARRPGSCVVQGLSGWAWGECICLGLQASSPTC